MLRGEKMQQILKDLQSRQLLQIEHSLNLFKSIRETNDLNLQQDLLAMVKQTLGMPKVCACWCQALAEDWDILLQLKLLCGLNELLDEERAFLGWSEELLPQLPRLVEAH